MAVKNRYIGTTYAVFTIIVIVFFAWAFYFTSLGEKVENELFDLRTKIKPNVIPTSGVLVLETFGATLAKLEGAAGEKMSLSSLEKITWAAKKTDLASINIIISANILLLSRPELEALVRLVQSDKRMRLGVIDVDVEFPSPRELPLPLRYIDRQIFSIDSFKLRTTDIVRTLPRVAYRGRELRASLPAEIAQIPAPELENMGKLYINYLPPSRLSHEDAFDFVQSVNQGQVEPYAGKHLIFTYGQIDNRRHLPRYTYVNTPWDDESASLLQGTYIADFIAIATLNYLHRNYLKPCPPWVVWVQTLLLVTVFGFAWRLGSTPAFLLLILGWFGTLYIHSVVFALSAVFIPFGATALFAILAGIVGGQWRLTHETKLRLAQEADTRTQQEITRVQTRFLDYYADGLEGMNESILGELLKLERDVEAAARLRPAYIKLLTSGEELRDYLSGIKQFSAITQVDRDFVHRTAFEVGPMVKKVVHQFDSKIEDRRIRVNVSCPEGLTIHADEAILRHIVFNLVSNAIKYSKVGGEVNIAVEAIGESVHFAVSDKGPGIPPEFQKLIFEKFYRVKDDMNIEVKGHGLGLYLSRYFAERLSGSIDVMSRLDEGSTFTLTLRGARKL